MKAEEPLFPETLKSRRCSHLSDSRKILPSGRGPDHMIHLDSFQSEALMISLLPLPLVRAASLQLRIIELILVVKDLPGSKATALPMGDSQPCQQDHPNI